MASSPSSRPRAVGIGWWVLAGWIALVALHLWIAWGVTGPIVLQDETGYLGNARWLAGRSPLTEMGDQPVYAWGYSLVLAPVVAVIDDPAVLYRAVQLLNSMLLASLLPLMWLVLRRVGGISSGTAAGAAAVGAVFPATLVHSSVAWSESLLPVLMALAVLTTWMALTERATWQRLLLGPVVVWAYAAHGRFLPVVGLVLVAAVAAGWKGLVPKLVGLVTAIGVGLGVAGVRLVNSALLEARWPDRVAGAGSEGRLLSRALNPTNWPGVAGGAIGQGWYLTVGSLGLAAVGTVALVTWIGRRPGRSPEVLAATFALVAMIALFATSVVSFVGSAERVDHLIYGRYNEAFVPLLVAAGAAALLVSPPHERRRLVLASAMFTMGSGIVLWVGRGPDAFEGEVVWNNVLGLRLVMEVVGQSWMVPAATVAAAGVLVGFDLTRRRPAPLLAVTAVALATYGVVAVGPLADFARVRYQGWELPRHLTRVIDVAEVSAVGLDRQSAGLVATLGYPFWLPDTSFRFTDTPRSPEPPGLVVGPVADSSDSRPDSSRFDTESAAIVALDARNNQAVWVLAGTAAFDRLQAVGALLPSGFPSVLDDAARRAHLSVTGDTPTTSPMSVAAGETVTLTVAVSHAGSGQPWPSDVEWPMPGVVRIGARWIGQDGEVSQESDWAALAGPAWPGDRQQVTLTLRAVDSQGAALAPGRYRVEINLFQADFGWFPEAEATTLEVQVG